MILQPQSFQRSIASREGRILQDFTDPSIAPLACRTHARAHSCERGPTSRTGERVLVTRVSACLLLAESLLAWSGASSHAPCSNGTHGARVGWVDVRAARWEARFARSALSVVCWAGKPERLLGLSWMPSPASSVSPAKQALASSGPASAVRRPSMNYSIAVRCCGLHTNGTMRNARFHPKQEPAEAHGTTLAIDGSAPCRTVP